MAYRDYWVPCVLYEKQRQSDGAGGWITGWQEGAEFDAFVGLSGSMETKQAAALGVKNVYSCAVDKGFPIENNDYFKRKKDGALFRVADDPTDQETPESSEIDVRSFSAERVDSLPK